MNTTTFILQYWNFNPLAIAFLVLLFLFHFISNGYQFSRESPIFFLAILLYIIATLSPVDYLGKHYLFSAHMIQHILLLLIIPPLLLVSINKDYLKKLTGNLIFQKTSRILFYPLMAWFLGVGSMWILHIPAFLKIAHHYAFLVNLQMILLPIFGSIFVWPAFSPVVWQKLQPLPASVYLFLSCVGCTVLGILITFAPTGMFMPEMQADNQQITNMIQASWGITTRTDQMMGGLIMWVPACVIYLSFIVIILFRWFSGKETEETSDESFEKHDIHYHG